MRDYLKFYINGEWVDPVTPRTLDVQNPANEESYARISIGAKADVDKAVAAAKAAFPAFSATTKEYRADLLDKIIAVYSKRLGDIAGAVSEEMGAPLWLAQAAHAPSPTSRRTYQACDAFIAGSSARVIVERARA